MAKLFQALFRGTSSQPSNEISRYDLSWYIQQLTNNPWGAYGGSSYTTTRDGRSVEEVSNSFTSYVNQAYKANGVVYAVMLSRRLVFSEARFQFRRLINGRPGDLFGTEALGIVEKPWPNATTGEMLGRADQDVSLGGNFYVADEGTRLRRLRPDWVQIVLTERPEEAVESDVAGYMYTPGGTGSGAEPRIYLPDEIAHWSPEPDPDAQYRGMSWLTPVLREIEADQAATAHKNAFFRNGAKPGLVVSLKESIKEEQFKRFVRAMNESHQGTDQAYRTLYLAGGADVTVAGADLRQLDFRATQGAGETRICAAGGVPPVIVGLSEGLQAATYSNYASARRKFGDGWARPMWRSVCAALETVVEVPGGAQLWYDDRDIAFLREDQKDAAEIQSTRAGTINTYITAGFTPESAVASVDADDLTLLVHSGMVSVQLQPPGGGVPEEDPAGEAMPPLDGPASDEDADALVDAMAEIDTAARAWSGAQSALHPRGHGGKFRSTKDRLVGSLNARKAGGGVDPFEMFSREQLHKVAKARGVDVKKGAGKEDISSALLDSLHGGANPSGLTGGDDSKLHGVKKPAKPSAPERPAAAKPERTSTEDAPGPTFRGGSLGDALTDGLQESDIADVRRFLEEATNFTHPGSGMTATVRHVSRQPYGNPDAPAAVDVTYEIRDRDGNVVGVARRQWVPPGEDDYGNPRPVNVWHNAFELEPSAQGNGFARAWNEQMERAYRANGVREVHLQANEDVGGYAWAKQGYGWPADEGETTRDMASRIESALEGSAWPAADVEQFRTLAERLRTDAPEDAPTPLELSMVGWSPGAKTWPGKEFMLASAWEGVKQL